MPTRVLGPYVYVRDTFVLFFACCLGYYISGVRGGGVSVEGSKMLVRMWAVASGGSVAFGMRFGRCRARFEGFLHFHFFYSFFEFGTCLSAFGARKASCNDRAKLQVLVRSNMDVGVGGFREGVVCRALWFRTSIIRVGVVTSYAGGVGCDAAQSVDCERDGVAFIPNLTST